MLPEWILGSPFGLQSARKLKIETLELLCRQENVMKAWVITNRSNVGAVRLYESTGAAAGSAKDEMIFTYQQ